MKILLCFFIIGYAAWIQYEVNKVMVVLDSLLLNYFALQNLSVSYLKTVFGIGLEMGYYFGNTLMIIMLLE